MPAEPASVDACEPVARSASVAASTLVAWPTLEGAAAPRAAATAVAAVAPGPGFAVALAALLLVTGVAVVPRRRGRPNASVTAVTDLRRAAFGRRHRDLATPKVGDTDGGAIGSGTETSRSSARVATAAVLAPRSEGSVDGKPPPAGRMKSRD